MRECFQGGRGIRNFRLEPSGMVCFGHGGVLVSFCTTSKFFYYGAQSYLIDVSRATPCDSFIRGRNGTMHRNLLEFSDVKARHWLYFLWSMEWRIGSYVCPGWIGQLPPNRVTLLMLGCWGSPPVGGGSCEISTQSQECSVSVHRRKS